jgi:hypothetical protein
MESNASAAQPGPPTKQQRLTAIAAGIRSLQGDVDTNTSIAQPGAAATAATTAAAAVTTTATTTTIKASKSLKAIVQFIVIPT